MAERRSLVAGLNVGPGEGLKVDPAIVSEFVYGGKGRPARSVQEPPGAAATNEGKGKGANSVGRAPLTVRFRSDFAAALKRASLERQLNGIVPHTLQDILEEAVEPWLRTNGYLSEGPA